VFRLAELQYLLRGEQTIRRVRNYDQLLLGAPFN